MEFRQVVRMALERNAGDLKKTLDGLTAQERRFQPAPQANHIDYIVWHLARVEDDFIHRALLTDSLWQREGWYEQLGLPETGNGTRYDAEQVRGLPPFDMTELWSYYEEVRTAGNQFIDTLTDADLERPARTDRPEYTIGHMLSHLMVEVSQHAGEVAYLRGLQRGLGPD